VNPIGPERFALTDRPPIKLLRPAVFRIAQPARSKSRLEDRRCLFYRANNASRIAAFTGVRRNGARGGNTGNQPNIAKTLPGFAMVAELAPAWAWPTGASVQLSNCSIDFLLA
jgi:hypothetical protein